MIPTTWIWVLFFSLVSESVESLSAAETQTYTCKMFGSGIIQTFNASSFHVRTNCPFTLTHFTHDQVDYDITTLRGDDGLLSQMEIIVNKIRTVVQIGGILVEKKSVSLPYDHTYQHIFQYGTYTRLRSLLFPLSVTWHTLPAGIDTVMVELEQGFSTEMTGLCGQPNVSSSEEQLITSSMIPDDFCQIRDNVFAVNHLCNKFFSHTMDCLQDRNPHFLRLCEENMYSYESSDYVRCSFFSEVVQQCRHNSYIWIIWRTLTGCAAPTCPGDLVYEEQGAAFVPSCSNFNPSHSRQNLIRSCVCPEGSVLNDQTDGFHCVNISKCPCKFAGRSYVSGDKRSTNCQTCVCQAGGWHCSENSCPPRCLLEGQFVTTFDGKQYAVPGKCAYVASQGLNWTIMVRFSEKYSSLHTAVLQLPQVTYTFSINSVKVGDEEISELHESDHALVFWQSSMFVQVQTSFGMKIQVQMSPEIQLYITLPRNNPYNVSGLCGNSNNDTTDDFTTSTGIVENSPQPFALSWSVGTCVANIPPICSSTDSEIFADEMCSVLRDQTGIFAKCHDHIPADQFYTTCVGRTCNCGSHLQQCLCVALGSYAKACAILGVAVGDWRKATNCTLTCANNQQFFYDTRTCNHTCRSLSGPDPRCWSGDAPVEGCGCPEGTHLNQGGVCTPKSECECHYRGGAIQPGPVVIDGLQCLCENGELHCSKDCGCRNGKVCYHCSERPVNTAQKTCDSLGKLQAVAVTCESGCYCPHDQYEDHRGNCVSMDNCTCVYSGKVFAPGQHVKTNCKTCTCGQGRWHCTDEPCPGQCQVYGNGHYQTFDSKWYRFNGHCQYTLVEDHCGNENGSFSVSVESVPCCDEEMTCSRSIVLDIYGTVTLTLSDQRVTRRLQTNTTSPMDLLYATRTVGLYIIVSVPSKGITLIWDKHTRITVELQPNWRSRVCGLCGNFDSSAMNDLRTSGSAVLSSPMVFGNSWKAATPPCSDVTTEMFPCKRNSYCAAWAQRRCMIITSDTFKDCHLKVDPEPYYQACVQESCSCEFEGKFLGFCTAVAAYAEACSDQDVCVNWRTPDLCPVYCDYYNQQGQCTWHYQACGEVLTCGKDDYFTHKLEGCYPRCPEDSPYYDENTGECTTLVQCTCSFNGTVTPPGAKIMLESIMCHCENGSIQCPFQPTTAAPTTHTSTFPTTSPTTETTPPSPSPTTPALTTVQSQSTASPTPQMPTSTNDQSTTKSWSVVPSTTPIPTTEPASTTSATVSTSSTTATWTTATSTAPTSPLGTTPSTTSPTTETTPPSSSPSPTTPALTTVESQSTASPTSQTPTTTNDQSTTKSWSEVPSTTPIPTTEPASTTSATVSTATWTTATSTAPTSATATVVTSTVTWSETTPNSPSLTTGTTGLSTSAATLPPSTTSGTEPPTSVGQTTALQPSTSTAAAPESTTVKVVTAGPHTPKHHSTTHSCEECRDLKRKKTWACNEVWTEDCFNKTCVGGKIELTPVVCPEPTVPTCPRDRVTKVSDGCCETWKCDCRCDLYGDPHYITFEGVAFDFLDECTYILVEERSPQHHLSISVDNFFCMPGSASCAKGISLRYQSHVATLSIIQPFRTVQVALDGKIIQPPYEEHGLRFETTGYVVSVHLPDVRSYVSLSPSYTLVVNLAMEHFFNNTQGQCGVCGGPSCVRREGQIEDNSCCDKTAYDWVVADSLKPACSSAPRNVSCHPTTPTDGPFTRTTTCPSNPVCELLEHPVFSECREKVNLQLKKRNCQTDSCGNRAVPCSALEQAAEECKNAGVCVDWRTLTDGSCDVACSTGLVYRECSDKLDDFCYGGQQHPGSSLDKASSGCFCPSGQIRAGKYSVNCVSNCSYCKGPMGEPRLPGEVWKSNCLLCTCNSQTLTEQCFPKPSPPAPLCSPGSVLVNVSCCGDQACVEKTCSYKDKTYKIGDTWKDAALPCMSFNCTKEGVHTDTDSVTCPEDRCPGDEVRRVEEKQPICSTCEVNCSPKMSRFDLNMSGCATNIELPVCQGLCLPQHRVAVLHGDLQVVQSNRCCQERSSVKRSVTLQCSDHTSRLFTYEHITSCECRTCGILR